MIIEKTIALTGGIATGKSSAGRFLSRAGYVVIDCDAINRLWLKDKGVVGQLIDVCGTDIINHRGELDRYQLRNKMFCNSDLRKVVENILHPLISQTCQQWRQQTKGTLIIEIPLISERWINKHRISQVIWVTAPVSMRMARLKDRGWSKEIALNVINAQPSEQEYAKLSTHCLMNQLTHSAMHAQLKYFMK